MSYLCYTPIHTHFFLLSEKKILSYENHCSHIISVMWPENLQLVLLGRLFHCTYHKLTGKVIRFVCCKKMVWLLLKSWKEKWKTSNLFVSRWYIWCWKVERWVTITCCGKILGKVENSNDMEERNVDVRQNLTLLLANVERSMMIFLQSRLM